MWSGTVFGAIANYSCNSLYTIVGNTSRECQVNGTWSGFEPHCVLDNLETIIAITVAAVLVIIILVVGVLCVLCWQKKFSRKAPTYEDETFAVDSKG